MGRINLLKIQNTLMSTADSIFSWIPRAKPNVNSFADFQLISHRGEHDNINVFENTMKAFEKSRELPIAGIEFDVQWSKDLEPVVFHDKSLGRILGQSGLVSDFSLQELQGRFPQIPKLSDVVRAFREKHLMIEIKDGPIDWKIGAQKITRILSEEAEGSRFHIMSLTPKLFSFFSEIPLSKFLTIGKTNTKEMSQMALDNGWGGVTGHYLLVSQKMIDTHHQKGQVVGVGFPASLNSLYREYNRGVDFVFTNHSSELAQSFSYSLHQK